MHGSSLSLYAVPDIPLITPGDDLAPIIAEAMSRTAYNPEDNDIIVLAQKIVSKAEGRIVDLESVTPSQAAIDYAGQCDKDPRLVELILSESNCVLRCVPGVIIVEHRSGIVLANAGIDHSNVDNDSSRQLVTLLPEDANLSAHTIREKLQTLTNTRIGVIITDSIGRAWRLGTIGVAIGASGLMTLRDLRGAQDLFGKTLEVSETAEADALASAAGLLMGEGDDSSPVVVIRGMTLNESTQNSNDLLRPLDNDLFR